VDHDDRSSRTVSLVVNGHAFNRDLLLGCMTGSQPLKVAVTWDDVLAVELLLDADAAINGKHEGGDTALHHAIRMGNFGVARLLVRRGADQSIRNDKGELPRELCWSGEWEGLGLISTD
jgi:ankyrin repeat protein